MQIEKSEIMTKLSGMENFLIRMPKILRRKMNLELGNIVVIKNLPFQVNKIFNNDHIETFAKAFVSENSIKKLNIPTHTLNIKYQITLGCDPELFLVDTETNKLYNPGFLVKKTGSVGYDGMLAELRPDPDVDPCKVVDNLYKLIKELHIILLNKNLHNVSMLAKSSGWGLFAGFHIHLGIPKQLLDPTTSNYIKILRVIIKSLDYYVGTLAVLIENSDFNRRCNPLIAYGKVGDFRTDNKTLEYRVPGGALLKHPDLTKGLLSAASLVAHDVIERIRLFTEDFVKDIEDESKLAQYIYPNLIDTQHMFSLICSPSIEKAKKEYEIIKQDLCCMINYTYYEEALNRFMDLMNVKMSDNIWLNWSKKDVQR